MEIYRDYIETLATAMDVPAMISTEDSIEVIRPGNTSRTLLSALSLFLIRRRGYLSNNGKKVKKSFVRTEDKYGITFLSAILDNNPFVTAIFGPFSMGELKEETLVHDLCQLQSAGYTEETAKRDIATIQKKDAVFTQAWGRVVSSLKENQLVPFVKITTFANRNTEDSLNAELSQVKSFEDADIYTSYAFQKEIHQYAKQGDAESLRNMLLPKTEEALIKARDEARRYRQNSSIQNLRRIKNLLISVNTILRLAAEENGVTAIMLNNISESVIQRIEQSPSEDALLDVIEYMIKNYCGAINNSYLQNHSVNVVKVQRYIMNHLHEKIFLDDLCELTGLTESYLCRRFKDECRMTINEYIQEQRINEAKILLGSTDEPLMEIADKLGFSDQTYFSSVFKKVTGLTPRHYRANRGGFYAKN